MMIMEGMAACDVPHPNLYLRQHHSRLCPGKHSMSLCLLAHSSKELFVAIAVMVDAEVVMWLC